MNFMYQPQKKVFVTVTCQECGKTKRRLVIKTKSNSIKYCSRKCNQTYNLRRQRATRERSCASPQPA
jgi:hypothetical protein